MLRHKVPPEAKHLVRQHEVLSVRMLRKQHRKAIHLPPPLKNNAPQTRCFFLPKWAGKFGPCSSAASVTDIQSAPSPPRVAKPEFPAPIFGKKCRLFGKVLALLLGSFSHGHTVRSFAASCRKTRIFLAPFGKKSTGHQAGCRAASVSGGQHPRVLHIVQCRYCGQG